jgi:hypothetical protein
MKKTRYLKINSIILLSVIGSLLVYLLLKAYNLSFTHDESLSFEIINGNKLIANTANNHFLNTWLMHVFYNVFGAKEIFLRLPNILAFILYLIFTYKILIKANNLILMLLGASFLLFNPYLLDFFSLARGYGLSLGFGLASLYFLFKQNSFTTYKKYIKALSLSLLLSLFSAYSNLVCINLSITLMIIFAIELFVLLKDKTILLDKKRIITIVLIFGLNLIFLSFLVVHLLILKENNQLYHGGTVGFINDTLSTLIIRSIYFSYYGEEFWMNIRVAILLIYFITLAYQVYSKVYSNLSRITLILSLMILGSILQHYIFDALYPKGRTSLIFIPIFSLFVYYLSLEIYSKIVTKKVINIVFTSMLFVFLCLPITWHLVDNVNLKYTTEWKYDAYTKEVMVIIDENHKAGIHKSEKISISNNWLFKPSLNFYRDLFSMNYINIEELDGINKNPDYIYCFIEEKEKIVTNQIYTIIKEYKDIGTVLMKKSNSN